MIQTLAKGQNQRCEYISEYKYTISVLDVVESIKVQVCNK